MGDITPMLCVCVDHRILLKSNLHHQMQSLQHLTGYSADRRMTLESEILKLLICRNEALLENTLNPRKLFRSRECIVQTFLGLNMKFEFEIR